MKKKQKILVAVCGCALLLGLGLSLVIFNVQERKKDKKMEITFIDPHQAVVFWKTDYKTIGTVKYGSTKNNLDMSASQTSSQPSEVHAVVLNDIPTEGLYISLHTQSDRWFLLPETIQITFDPTTIE